MRSNYLNLAELFAGIAQEYPERPALKDCNRTLTYFELYRHSRLVATKLQEQDVLPGDRVICISRKNIESVLCFWGILLSGGIPVMLDHEDGIQVNEAKTKEVAAKTIILDKKLQGDKPGFELYVVLDFYDLLDFGAPLAVESNIKAFAFPDTCYILLTSGTTGKPKAVQISHENVVHYTYSIHEKLGFPQQVNAVHASTFAADLGLTNFLVALVSGGMLRILNKMESTDPSIFNEIIENDGITLLKITPSHLLSLISHLKAPYKKPIGIVVLGGEKLSWETVKTIFAAGICSNLFNHYGPTETTIGAIAYKVEGSSAHFNKTGSVPLGQPIGKGKCFVSDAKDNVGELHIMGPGVSIGYFNNQPENEKKFVVKEIGGENVVCYRTGDICKELDDGNFEFLYRTDRQVKISGYRIELGEIELVIASNPGVENVIVTVSDSQDHPVIHAYIKLKKEEAPITAEALRHWLSDKLPNYKIPANFYFYSIAPYNSNGKINMSALKKSFEKEEGPDVAENEPIKEESWLQLVGSSWRKILNCKEILKTDNFFSIGGDSLLAIQLIGKLQRHGYKVHITDLNNNPVFEDFVLLAPPKIYNEDKEDTDKKNRNRFTLSQQLFLQHTQFDLDNYCQIILLETDSKIRVRELAIALNCVLESHLQLTAVFKKSVDRYGPERKYGAGLELGTSILDGRKPVVTQIQEGGNALLNKISIGRGELFTAHIFVDPGGKDYLYLACHHLVIDVISWNIIIEELLEFYSMVLKGNFPSITTENIVTQFYNELSRKKIDKEPLTGLTGQRPYRLPDYGIKGSAPDSAEVCHILIPGGIAEILKGLDDQKRATTLNGLLISAFGRAVLSEFSIPEITVDVEFHGRPHDKELPDLSRSVAWWATTLPVHLEAAGLDPENCSALIERRANLANKINLYDDQFSELVNERPDIRFNYLGRFPEQFGNSSIQMRPSSFNPGPTRSKNAQLEYKLYFTARFIGNSLFIDLQYQAGRFSPSRIERIASLFFDALIHSLDKENYLFSPQRPLIHHSNVPSVGQPLYNLNAGPDGTEPGIKTIFLTGATGFLGIHLLRELSSEEEANIYCLVREGSQGQAGDRLEACYRHYFGDMPKERWARIKIVCGDILREKLGMSNQNYMKVAKEADIILHAAADINLLKDYSELMQANITATKSIVDLAQTGKDKVIHYVSTLAVSGYSPDGRYKYFSEDDFEYGQFFISDYEKTKFEAEKAIRYFLGNGGKGKIYRVGHIAADSVSGKFQRNIEQNRIFQIIKGALLLKMIPGAYKESISFSHVDIVARSIAHFCLGKISSDLPCIHTENAQYNYFNKIVEMLEQLGYDIEFVELDVFREAVANFEGDPVEKKIVDLMNSWIQRALDFPRRIGYTQRNSLDLIAQSGLYFPKLSMEWLSNVIQEGIKAGFFHSPSSVSSPSPLLLDAEIF